MNSLIIAGNVGGKPEFSVSANGTKLLKFSVATKRWKKGDPDDWHRCTFFGDRAEKIAEFLESGAKVVVRGRVQNDQVDKDGEKRTYSSVIVEDVTLMGSKREDSDTPADTPKTSSKPVTSKQPVDTDWDSPGV